MLLTETGSVLYFSPCYAGFLCVGARPCQQSNMETELLTWHLTRYQHVRHEQVTYFTRPCQQSNMETELLTWHLTRYQHARHDHFTLSEHEEIIKSLTHELAGK